MKNVFGNSLTITLFGESHGPAVGAVLDGLAPGIKIDEEYISAKMDQRRPVGSISTQRKEADKPEFISGVFNGYTTGTPLCLTIKNENAKSEDYGSVSRLARPSHADLTARYKYGGFEDYRGGGHFSGRLTLPVVAAGVVAKKIIEDATVLDDTPVREINARIVELGGIPGEGMPEQWKQAIDNAIKEGDSLGAVIECTVPEIDPGYGEPFWDSVEALVAHAVFSIPGVRGIEFGDGFRAAAMKGSEHNDPIGDDGRPTKNGAGGVNGGITNGAPVRFRVAFKPTSSIRKPQETFNFQTGEMDTLEIPGRHDACFALRAPVVVEAMTAIVLADLILMK